jgi:hypothetical protein
LADSVIPRSHIVVDGEEVFKSVFLKEDKSKRTRGDSGRVAEAGSKFTMFKNDDFESADRILMEDGFRRLD